MGRATQRASYVIRGASCVTWLSLSVGLVLTTVQPAIAAPDSSPPASASVGTSAVCCETARSSVDRAFSLRDRDEQLARKLAETAIGLPDRDVASRGHYLLGELEERARNYPAAINHYRTIMSLDPGNFYAGSARIRLEALTQDQPDFAHLAILDETRKDPIRSADVRVVEGLLAQARSWPISRVRDEALMFCAEAFLARLGRPADAMSPALEVGRNSQDPLRSTMAFQLAYASATARQDYVGLRALLREPRLPTELAGFVRRDLRRFWLEWVSFGVVIVNLLMFFGAMMLAWRSHRLTRFVRHLTSPLPLTFVVTATLGGRFLAEAWEAGLGVPFLPMGVGLLVAHLLVSAAKAGFGNRSVGYRLVAAASLGGFVLAWSYLVLAHSQAHGASFLDGFGL